MRMVFLIGFIFGLWLSVAYAQHWGHHGPQGSDWVRGQHGDLQGRDWPQRIWPRPAPYSWERCWRQNFFGQWERVC